MNRGRSTAAATLAVLALVLTALWGTPTTSAQEEVSRTVTATAYVCPAGMTADTLDPSLCTVTTSGFNLLIGSLEGEMEPYNIGDASSDGTSFTWDLGTQGPGTTTRWFIRNEVVIVPDTTYIVTGDIVGPVGDQGNYRFDTSYDLPNPVLSVYNFIPATEQEESTITIHQRICDSSYDGGDLFEECHQNILGEAYEINIGSDVRATDPTTGNVTFTVTGDVAVMADNSGSNVDFILSRQVYCSYTDTGEAIEISHAGQGVGYGTRIFFTPGSDITCDWYQFLTDTRPGETTPTSTPTPSDVTPTATATSGPVTTLPGTGAGNTASSSMIMALAASAVVLLVGGFALRRRMN